MLQVNSTFYWCGESYKQAMLGDYISAGINLYSSSDLQSWHFEGMIFNSTQIADMPSDTPHRVERPKASCPLLQNWLGPVMDQACVAPESPITSRNWVSPY